MNDPGFIDVDVFGYWVNRGLVLVVLLMVVGMSLTPW